jgi:cell division transport system permease protein
VIDSRSVRKLGSAARSGLRGMRSAPGVFAISVGTMAAGLCVLGAYLLVVQNMRGVLDSFGDELRVVAYLAPGEDPGADARLALERELQAIPGVAALRWVSPAAALERLRGDLGPDADVLDGLGRNPLPGSFEIEIAPGERTPDGVRALVAALDRHTGIADVRWGEDWVEGYARLLRAAEWIGLALGLFLAGVLAAIASGTIRLAVHARADEIQIQRLVGAGPLFIRLPFYLEGALQGAFASALAIALLYALYRLGLPLLREPLAYLLGQGEPSFFGIGAILGLGLLGVALGVGGAALSLLRLEERQA